MSSSSQTPSPVRADILAGLRATDEAVVGDLTPEALLDAYRDEVRAEAFASAANFLAEIGTPINRERSQHDTGVMYASERLRAFATGGAA
ncbi:hypothetical protein [Streptomyces sp. BH104]|uniref:hypothetical protein n=1 Tax=Streptomyces sp. BH104 TaxID=3410407 RepID=UPI003BB50D8B